MSDSKNIYTKEQIEEIKNAFKEEDITEGYALKPEFDMTPEEAEHIESESVSENQTKAAVEEKKTEKETKPKAESSDRPTPEEIEEEAEIPDALSDISMAETVPELPQF